MREIKFRVWDKILRVMENVLVFYHNNQEVYFIHKGCSQNRAIPNVELMQFTGLKDKNEKEIYEGDIVEILAENQQVNRLIVKYGIAQREMASNWLVDIPSFYFELNPGGFKAFPIVVNWNRKHDLEMMKIIGNIYENPELLKVN